MLVCFKCREELPIYSGTVTSMLAGSVNCDKCGTFNVIPLRNMEKESRREYSNCSLFVEKIPDCLCGYSGRKMGIHEIYCPHCGQKLKDVINKDNITKI